MFSVCRIKQMFTRRFGLFLFLFLFIFILSCLLTQSVLAADRIAVSLVLDHSGSMDTNDAADIRIASAGLIADLMEGGSDWGAAVGFDDTANIQVPMTRDMSALKDGLTETGYGRGTNFGSALAKALDTLNDPAISAVFDARKAVVIFTDGKDTSFDTSVLDTFVQNSWRIYAIGFGNADDTVLQNIADTTGGQYIEVTTTNMQVVMPAVIADIRGEIPPVLDEEELSQDEHVTQTQYVSPNQVLDWIKFTAIWEQGSDIDFYIVSPSGSTYQTDFSGANYGVYTINNPESGTWTMHMIGTNAADGSISVDYGASYELSDYGSIQANADPSGSQCRLGSSGSWYSAPHLYQNVAPGSYTIYCNKSGYTQASRSVALSAGEQKTVSFLLTAETGNIQVTSAQSGAEARLGSSGTWHAIPHTFSSVPTGSYTIYARKNDYHTASESIYLSSNETETVSFDLQPVGDIGISTPTLDYNWEHGTGQTIMFTSVGVENIKVELYKGTNLIEVISSSLPATDGQIAYTPPLHLTTANDYRIKITSLENSDILGWTPHFRIVLETIQIGGLTIESDGIWETAAGSNIWVANGNTTINNIVKVNAALTIDLNSLTLSGNGGLVVGPLAGDIVPQTQIWNGEFAFSVTDTLLQLGSVYMDIGNDLLELAGCPVRLYEFSFVEKDNLMGIEVKGELVLPDEWGGLAVDFGSQDQNLRIDQEGVGFSGTIDVPDIQFATWGIKDAVLTFNYWDEATQTRLNFFSAETMITFPAKFDMEAALDIRDGRIDLIGFGVDAHDPGIQIVPPLPQPGAVYFQKAYGEAYNLSNPEPWGVRLGKKENGDLVPEGLVLTAGPEYHGFYALKAKLGLDINSAGYMWGNGDLFVFNDEFNIAGGDIYLGLDYGAYVGGWMSWDFGKFVLENQARMMLDLSNTLRGQLTGKVTMNWPWDDFASVTSGAFMKVSEVDADDIPDKYVMAWVDVAGINVAALYNFASGEAVAPANMELVEDVSFPAQTLSAPSSISALSAPSSASASETVVATPNLTLAGQYVFILKSTRDIADFQLEKPDSGTRVTPTTSAEQYVGSPGKGALYVVDVPQEELGEWKMLTSSAFNTAGASVEVRRVLPLPQLDNVQVSTLGSNSYQIEWEDYDPSEGLVTVFYSVDGTLVNSVQIAKLDAAASTNSIIWSTQEVASGEYTIIVMIEQNGQIPVTAKTHELVKVIDSDASATPTNIAIDGTGGAVTVSWDPVTDAAGYTVEYRDLLAMKAWPSFNIVDSAETQTILTGLIAGRKYQVRVRSFNADIANSPWAGWYDIEVQAAAGMNSPPSIEGGLAPMAQSGIVYQGTIRARDADTDAVSFALLNGPTGFNLTSDGQYSWTPDDSQIGWQTLTITADDGNANGTTSAAMNVLVAHQSAGRDAVCAGTDFANLEDLLIETWGESFTYTFEVDTCFDQQTAITAAGLPDGATLVDNGNGTANLIWTPEQSAIGIHDNIEISLSDGYHRTSHNFSITVKDLRAAVTIPRAESRVSGIMDIYGTSYADADFASGVLEFRPQDGSYSFVTFIADTVENGLLYQGFDTTIYSDGLYEFRIKAYDLEGNYAESVQRFSIDNTPAEVVDGLLIESIEGNRHTTLSNSELNVSGQLNENADVHDYRYVSLDGAVVGSDVLDSVFFSTYRGLSGPRRYHSSVVVDGKIYVIGGSDYSFPNGGRFSSVEVIDTQNPSQGWQVLSNSLNIAREGHSSVVVDGKIYVIGGRVDSKWDSYLSSVEVYDTQNPSQGWQVLSNSLNMARAENSSVAIDSKIYVIGGRESYSSNDQTGFSVEFYDTQNPSQGWQVLNSSLNISRASHSSVAENGKIYVIGGISWSGNSGSTSSSMEVYDTQNPSQGWQVQSASLNISRNGHSSVVIDGKIYVIGGPQSGNTCCFSMEVYDTINSSRGWQIFGWVGWEGLERGDHSSVSIDNYLYVIGGLDWWNGPFLSSVQRADLQFFQPFRQVNHSLTASISSHYTSHGDTFRLEIQLIDEAGNISDWMPSNYMVIDTTPPEVTITRPSNNANVDASSGFVTISGFVSDDLGKPARVQWSKNGTDWSNCSLALNWQGSTWSAQVPVVGFQTTIHVKGFDSAGNESIPQSVTFSHFSDLPVAKLTAPGGNLFKGADPIAMNGSVYNAAGHSGFSWSLEISEGDGSSPAWETLVENATTAVINSTLHNWPAPVDSSQYTIKLTATNDYGTIATTQTFDYHNSEFIDNDADGLPDNWEIFKLGYLFYNGDDNVDEDSSTNQREFDDGTDPLNSESYLLTNVINISSTAPNAVYGVGDAIDITVQFEDAVTVTGTPQIVLDVGDVDAIVDFTSGSGTDTLVFTYRVAAGHESDDLDYSDIAALRLNGGNIKDSYNSPVDLSLPVPGTDGSLAANKDVVVDTMTVLGVTKTGSGSGIVSSSPTGIVCGGSCSATYDKGSSVTLTAAADNGYEVSSWGGNCGSATGNSCTLTMDADRSVSVFFVALDTDGDGVSDLEDAFFNDPAASVDSDGDGYPDRWNDGKDASDSTTGLTLDAFPDDPSEWIDSDGDGYGDNEEEEAGSDINDPSDIPAHRKSLEAILPIILILF